MLDQILSEVSRIDAFDVRVTMYKDTQQHAEQFVRVETDHAFWHLKPEQLLRLLKQLPDGAGNEAVRLAIETHEVFSSRTPPAPPPLTPP